ncbi:helix-turn-helix domain-containing protein, partial [bacterium]|nr:helix-turn-helix domain-containing protein [bacterium]
MAKSFKRLRLADREKLAILRAKGKTIREIAKKLGFSHSTISREFRRYGKFNYSPCHSDFHSQHRRRKAGRKPKIWGHEDLMSWIDEKLRLGWSPQLIAGRISKDHPGLSVSHETVYQYVFENQLHHLLPSQR